MAETLERARLLKIGEVQAFVGVGESCIKNMVQQGRLPAPLKLSRKCIRWRAGDLADWVEAGAGAGVKK